MQVIAVDSFDHFLNNGSPQDAEEDQEEAAERALIEFIEGLSRGEILVGTEQIAADYQKRDIMNRNMPTQSQWDGVLSLSDLFKSEDIPSNTTPEHYFDQRYIDYLNAQSGDLDSIHWRQFEYLTGEYFHRVGYKVTITPPRGDGGIDIIAEKSDPISGPDLIIAQCRRYSTDHPVSLDEVKAYWTTIDDRRATKGMIVTTSRLTSGGHTFIEARKYRLSAIEGENVIKWLRALSSRG